MLQSVEIGELLADNPVVGEVRAGPRRFWTGREQKILKTHYPQGGVPGCLPLLPGRTASAIYNRAGQLGLRVPVERSGWPRQRWESNEHIDALIARTYQAAPKKNDINRLAKTIARPRWWVSKRAQKLGLVQPRFKEPKWSEAEKDIILSVPHLHPKSIQKRLKRQGFTRTETAIVVKLKRLGASRRDDPNHFTARGLADVMGVDSKAITGWIAKGWLKANRKGTARTEAQGGDEWWIHRKDVRRFIIDNAAAVDIRKVDKFWFIDLLADKSAEGRA